jgi:hypothetical protein
VCLLRCAIDLHSAALLAGLLLVPSAPTALALRTTADGQILDSDGKVLTLHGTSAFGCVLGLKMCCATSQSGIRNAVERAVLCQAPSGMSQRIASVYVLQLQQWWRHDQRAVGTQQTAVI